MVSVKHTGIRKHKFYNARCTRDTSGLSEVSFPLVNILICMMSLLVEYTCMRPCSAVLILCSRLCSPSYGLLICKSIYLSFELNGSKTSVYGAPKKTSPVM